MKQSALSIPTSASAGPIGPQGPAGLPGDNPNISLGQLNSNAILEVSSVVGWTGPNQIFAAGDWYVKGFASVMIQALNEAIQIPFTAELHLAMSLHSGIEPGGPLVADLGTLTQEIKRTAVMVNSSPIIMGFSLEKLLVLPIGDYHLEIAAYIPGPRDPLTMDSMLLQSGMQAFFWP